MITWLENVVHVGSRRSYSEFLQSVNLLSKKSIQVRTVAVVQESHDQVQLYNPAVC